MMLFSIGTGLERVGVAGSDSNSWLIGDAGYWIVGARVGLLLLLIGRLWVWHSPARRTKRKKGRRGLRPWPLRCLSQILYERKERMLRLLSIGVWIYVPFTVGGGYVFIMYVVPNLRVVRILSYWMRYFLPLSNEILKEKQLSRIISLS